MNKKDRNEVPVVDIGNIVDNYLGENVNNHTDFIESKMNETASKNIPKIDGIINDNNNLFVDDSKEEKSENNLEDYYDLQIDFDKDCFMNGIKDISYLAAQIASLSTLGVSPDEALKYFASMKDLETSVKIANIQKEMAIECAKYGSSADI